MAKKRIGRKKGAKKKVAAKKATKKGPIKKIVEEIEHVVEGIRERVKKRRARRKAEECGLEFVVRINGKPLYIDPAAPFVQECLTLADRPKATTVSYGTDGAMLGALRLLLVCGPGGISQAHTHDEWMALEQLDRGTELYATMIRHWCT